MTDFGTANQKLVRKQVTSSLKTLLPHISSWNCHCIQLLLVCHTEIHKGFDQRANGFVLKGFLVWKLGVKEMMQLQVMVEVSTVPLSAA